MSRHLTTFFLRPLSRMRPSFPHRKEGDVEKKGCRQREREERLLTGLGGPCQTAVSGPAAHPRISLRGGFLCGSAPAVKATDTRTGRGVVGVLGISGCIRHSSAACIILFQSERGFFSKREARSHDVSVESRSASKETPF